MKANAVFAGGGIKGIGLLGAFSVAEEQGYRWEKLAGTSVGGMLAALVASGYKAREIYEIIEVSILHSCTMEIFKSCFPV